jgi:hypothetical protein
MEQAVSFSATNIYLDWANIMGGNLLDPIFQQIGTITLVTGGPISQGGTMVLQNYPNRYGTLNMNVTPLSTAQTLPYPAYPQLSFPFQYPSSYPPAPSGFQSKTANAVGTLTLSPFAQQEIISILKNGSGVAEVLRNASSYCISGLAINAGHYQNIIYDLEIYLFLNRTSNGVAIYFK